MVNIKNIIVSSSSHVANFTNERKKNEMDFLNLFNIHIFNEDVVMIDKNAKQTAKWKTKIAYFKKQWTIALLKFRFEQLKKKIKTEFIISIFLFKSVENNFNVENMKIQTFCKKKKRFKIFIIFKYKNKTQVEYKKFIKSCVKIFDMKKTIYRDEFQQIQCAIVHLNRDSDAVWFWFEKVSKSIIWQKFSKWLLNELMSKNQQKFHMYWKYKNTKQLKNQTINEYIIYFKNIESNIVTFSEKQKIHFFFHELNQKIYIQLMYNTIFINFNVLCDKTIQIESIKKKTVNQGDKSEGKSKRIQSFFGQHKTFPYGKNGNKNRNHFQNKNEKNDRRGGQKKKYHARKRFTGSPATDPNMVKSECQQNVFKKKIKCYNCQKLKHYVNDCFESDHKQQKNVRNQ